MFFVVFALLLSGCNLVPKEKIITTPVAVYSCPEPAVIERPELQIYSLSSEDYTNYSKIATTCAATIKELQDYAIELEKQLNVYRKK